MHGRAEVETCATSPSQAKLKRDLLPLGLLAPVLVCCLLAMFMSRMFQHGFAGACNLVSLQISDVCRLEPV